MKKIGNVGLITIDPITAYMGGKMDSHKATEVRVATGAAEGLFRADEHRAFDDHPSAESSRATGTRSLHRQPGVHRRLSCRAPLYCGNGGERDGERIPTGRILFTNVRNTAYRRLMPTLAYRKKEVTVETSGARFRAAASLRR